MFGRTGSAHVNMRRYIIGTYSGFGLLALRPGSVGELQGLTAAERRSSTDMYGHWTFWSRNDE